VEKYGRARHSTDVSVTLCMCFACWVIEATNTHSEYVMLIAFTRQQWLHEHASILGYTYIACFVLSVLTLCVSFVISLCYFVHVQYVSALSVIGSLAFRSVAP